MMATGYTIAGILLGTTAVVAAGVCLGLWFTVKAMRPELLERRGRDRD